MKATHDGTCQVCGNYQKLPGGNLSKHGYTKQWGFFSGTCWGAENLPFEQSKDLIDLSIARAKQSLADTEAESAALKAGRQFEDGKAWAHVYVGYAGRGRNQSPYRWTLVNVVREVVAYNDGDGKREYVKFHYEHEQTESFSGKKRMEKTEVNVPNKWNEKEEKFDLISLEEANTHCNMGYAKSELDTMAASLRRYIAWQEDRIKNWTGKPLKVRVD